MIKTNIPVFSQKSGSHRHLKHAKRSWQFVVRQNTKCHPASKICLLVVISTTACHYHLYNAWKHFMCCYVLHVTTLWEILQYILTANILCNNTVHQILTAQIC